MMFNLSNRNKLFASLLLITGAIFLGLSLVNRDIRQNLSDSTCATLQAVMEQQADHFVSELEREKKFIRDVAEVVANSSNIDDITPTDLLKFASAFGFDNMIVASPNGGAIASNGGAANVSEFPFFQSSILGEAFVSEPFLSPFRPATVIAVSAPLRHEGKVVGVLAGSYTFNKLDGILESSFGGRGYAFITDNEGDIIARTHSDYAIMLGGNLFETWRKNGHFYEHDSYDTMRANLYQDKSGHAKYQLHGKNRLMHYSTIKTNKWNIFTVVPEEVIEKQAMDIISTVQIMVAVFVALFILLILAIVKMQNDNIKKLSDIAFIDELTGAPTLAKFKQEAQRILRKNSDKRYLLVKTDIDRFKLVNQIYGFDTGDKLLKAMAKGFAKLSEGKDEVFARVSNDDFLYLHELSQGENIVNTRQKYHDYIFEHMGDKFTWHLAFPAGHYYVTAEDTGEISLAIEKTNIAQRRAKSAGLPICVYDSEMIKEAIEAKNIENKMEEAFSNGEFKMFLQGKRYLDGEGLAGAEALARWQADEQTITHPIDFVPVFEKNGFVTKLDMFIFEEACKFIASLVNIGKKPLVVSVNFSRLHLNNEYFVEDLCNLTDKYKVARKYLEIEITETAVLDNENLFNSVLDRLHEAGFTLSMDDFGTGYSSLGLLKNINFDVIKIDRSFFIDTPKPEKARLVLKNVISMAKDLGISTVAEGVELQEHIDLLRELGCDIVQGYYYAKPMPVSEFEERFSSVI